MYARMLEPPERQSFFFIYTGSRRWHQADIEILPADDALRRLEDLIG